MNQGLYAFPGTELISLPRGIIVMWSGSGDNCPLGWQFCDGTGGTPDLRSRFILGTATSATSPGTTGGALTQNYTPAGTNSAPIFTGSALAGHSHATTGTTSTDGAHSHTYSDTSTQPSAVTAAEPGAPGVDVASDDHTHDVSGTTSTDGDHSHTTSGTTDSVSGGTPAGTVSEPIFSGTPAVITTTPPYYTLALIMKL